MFLRIEAYGLMKSLRDFYFMRAAARLRQHFENAPISLKNLS